MDLLFSLSSFTSALFDALVSVGCETFGHHEWTDSGQCHQRDLGARELRGQEHQVGTISFFVSFFVVVVYHVTIVAIGHGLVKKFWPFF